MRIVPALFVVLAAALAGCSDSDDGDDGSDPPGLEYTAAIHDASFHPATVTILDGGKVTWVNNDPGRHSIQGEGGLSSNPLGRGETYFHVFNVPGVYDYHCGFHANMEGKVIVKEAE